MQEHLFDLGAFGSGDGHRALLFLAVTKYLELEPVFCVAPADNGLIGEVVKRFEARNAR